MNNTLTVLIFLVAILVIGGLVLLVIMLTKRTGGSLDVTAYQKRWLTIEQALGRDEAASHQLVVLQADKLLDQALRERGFAGQTMGERMKSAQNTWSNANVVWSAHKLRNRIAHETSVSVSYNDARQALAGFKRGLKDLGAI